MFNSIQNQHMKLSIRDGLYMPFMYKGRQIVVYNASWSFREKIWVDDELVISRVGISMTSTHVLDVAGDRLEVTYGYRDRMQEIFLEAKVGDEVVHVVNERIGKEVKPATLALAVIGCAVAGMAFGYAMASLVGWLTGGA
jgi:hypothetical protein